MKIKQTTINAKANFILAIFFAIVLCTILSSSVEATSLNAESQAYSSQQGCVIPNSGPWPPCATGGNPNAGSNGCIIPESGPWPPCATEGGSSTNTTSNNNGCIIPDSGPWPPCATNGSPTTTTTQTNGCVIPESGPWPPCATGGGNQTNTTNNTNSTPTTNTQNTAKSKTFTLAEARRHFVTIWNANPHFETQVARDSTFTLNNNVLLLVSPEKVETISGQPRLTRQKMDFSYRIGVENGNLTLSCIYLEVHHLRVSEAECSAAGDDYATWLSNYFKNDLLWADELVSIQADGDSMIVGYR